MSSIMGDWWENYTRLKGPVLQSLTAMRQEVSTAQGIRTAVVSLAILLPQALTNVTRQAASQVRRLPGDLLELLVVEL